MRSWFGSIVVCLWLGCSAISCSNLPVPFDADTHVPRIDYGGSEQRIEHLGTVAKLHTIVPSHRVFDCKFVIQTRNHLKEVVFEPSERCVDDRCHWYQFDIAQLALSGYSPNRRTIILIAGYMSTEHVDWFDDIADLWLKVEDVNIIRVSWSDGNKYFYEKAVSGVPIVARQLVILLHYLASMHGSRFDEPSFADKVQIVGHSLGGHIAGYVGQDMSGRLGRITALDPAGPFFDRQQSQFRLDQTDARFVESIHTNSGQIHYISGAVNAAQSALDWVASKVPIVKSIERSIKESLSTNRGHLWYGINQQVSHVDYYANNGHVQPGCESVLHICDHGRAHEIYRDLLAHETRLETQYGPEARRKNRLLAFRSDSFKSFSVGSNLQARCPSVLRSISGEIEEALPKCSVPLDLLGNIDELVAEFRDSFGVSSLENPKQQPQAKYYFKTRSQSPLLGHHYLLRIPIVGEIVWSSECSLEAEVRMADGLRTNWTVIEGSLSENPISYDGSASHISAVFVVADQFNEPILSAVGDNETLAIDKYLPDGVSLRVQDARSKSVVKTVISKLWNILPGQSTGDDCYLSVGTMEILPLINSQVAITGKYGPNSDSDSKRVDGDTVLERHLSQVIAERPSTSE